MGDGNLKYDSVSGDLLYSDPSGNLVYECVECVPPGDGVTAADLGWPDTITLPVVVFDAIFSTDVESDPGYPDYWDRVLTFVNSGGAINYVSTFYGMGDRKKYGHFIFRIARIVAICADGQWTFRLEIEGYQDQGFGVARFVSVTLVGGKPSVRTYTRDFGDSTIPSTITA